ncbi:MAG: hypothetical protein PHY31_10685 [Smithellaceae bacterium]|nr:hypothetical protein [Smithellaceae bacterium]
MTHYDEGHYGTKRTADLVPKEEVVRLVKQRATDGAMKCSGATRIAEELGVSMGDVGATLDLLKVRITHCQLGLFGYSPEKKVVKAAAVVEPDLEKAIREGLVGGKLPCATAWAIATRLGIPKMAVSSACETLQFKVKPCQLGAF